ncbi:unnamed protein product [Somion occarium]|uniref:Uncharacterized protein n=1 Tax=Somion occarium TaxID=3059160 RepID=A0ABP1CG51_9APHY
MRLTDTLRSAPNASRSTINKSFLLLQLSSSSSHPIYAFTIMNEKLQRIVTRNPLLPLVVGLLGSVWFALSILSYCVGLLFPSTKHKLPPLSPPRNSDSASESALPTSILVAGQNVHHHVTFPESPSSKSSNSRPNAHHKRWSSPAEFSIYQASSASESSATLASNSSARKFRPDLSQIESGDGSDSPASLSSTLADEMSFSDSKGLISQSRRSSLTSMIPNIKMFKMKSKKGKESALVAGSSCTSSPLSMSPMSSPPRRLKELEADLDRLNQLSPPKAGSPRSGFSNPFKFRPKRSSATAIMSAEFASMEKPTLLRSSTHASQSSQGSMSPTGSPEANSETSLPSTTSSRKKRFTSILSLNLTIDASIPSPKLSSRTPRGEGSSKTATASSATPSHRRAFSSSFIPLTPNSRKTPKTAGPTPRTQPYGAPYFARMPTGEVASPVRRKSTNPGTPLRRTSLDETVLEMKEPEDETASTPVPATPTNALGLSIQQTRHLSRAKSMGHRRLASDSAIV